MFDICQNLMFLIKLRFFAYKIFLQTVLQHYGAKMTTVHRSDHEVNAINPTNFYENYDFLFYADRASPGVGPPCPKIFQS